MQQLASGSVPVSYESLPGGFRGTDETVKRMQQAAMGRYGARSPKIRALARNIIVAAGVPEKDYQGEALALGNWVKNNIRYMKDVYGQETLSYPEETAFNMKAGDCDDKSTLLASLLGAVGIPSRFKVIGVTPYKYSHVYLQTRPKDKWITMDTIMRDKPVGWEVPQGRRAIEKTYPVNGIEGIGATGGNMSGLGYVGDPRTVSHLEEPSIPYGAGAGARGPKPVHRPNYVKMASMLDTDAPIDPMMAFPPNQNIPQRYPQQCAQSVAPEMQRLGPDGIHGEDETETMAFDGRHEVIGPDELASIEGKRPPENATVPAYMQTKTVVQRPEGVDAMFGRPSMVLDPNKGDKVEYYGRYSLAEKPPIRPYENIAGEEDNTLQVPTTRPQPRTGVMLAAVAAGLAALWYFKRK